VSFRVLHCDKFSRMITTKHPFDWRTNSVKSGETSDINSSRDEE